MIEGLAIVYISVKNEWIYKKLHETRYKCFSDDDDELLKKYSKIWDKVSNSVIKGFDGVSVCNAKHQTIKIKSYESKINPGWWNTKRRFPVHFYK